MEVERLIAEGVGLHDKGKYDEAIERYRRALAIDATNPVALAELSFSLYMKKDLTAALAAAKTAAAVPKPIAMAFVTLGSIQDDLGDSRAAIESYRGGIASYPDFPLLYFNLGTTYRRLKELRSARACLEIAVSLQPRHASSHLYLGRNYLDEGYRVPAILALTRFLFLENSGKRAEEVIGWLDAIFRQGVEKTEKGASIQMDPNAPKDEGDFSGSDLMISMLEATTHLTPEAGGKLEGPPSVDRLSKLLSVVGETGPEAGKGFAAEYYVPFVAELVNRKLATGYAGLVLRPSRSAEIDAWALDHVALIDDATRFAAEYKWPAVRPPFPSAGPLASSPGKASPTPATPPVTPTAIPGGGS